jgi:hypothetical protein
MNAAAAQMEACVGINDSRVGGIVQERMGLAARPSPKSNQRALCEITQAETPGAAVNSDVAQPDAG